MENNTKVASVSDINRELLDQITGLKILKAELRVNGGMPELYLELEDSYQFTIPFRGLNLSRPWSN